jgi:hypothetical protein
MFLIMTAAEPGGKKSGPRLLFIDNIRILPIWDASFCRECLEKS